MPNVYKSSVTQVYQSLLEMNHTIQVRLFNIVVADVLSRYLV